MSQIMETLISEWEDTNFYLVFKTPTDDASEDQFSFT